MAAPDCGTAWPGVVSGCSPVTTGDHGYLSGRGRPVAAKSAARGDASQLGETEFESFVERYRTRLFARLESRSDDEPVLFPYRRILLYATLA